MTADTVNAYYNPAGNEIVFPAGIMQAPVFYDPAIPQYLTYGAFGSVSGHELSHAFDSTGRHYDETGNFTDWWDDETVQSFKDKAKCFVDQYHEFTVPNSDGDPLHVNGRLTLGENIADAGGLNAAFAAWKEIDTGNPGELLPGLQHFSKEQLFFISYGNWWCGKARPETAINLIYRDPHSPTWARILVCNTGHRAISYLIIDRVLWRTRETSKKLFLVRRRTQPASYGDNFLNGWKASNTCKYFGCTYLVIQW